MARYPIVTNGFVVNIIEASETFAQSVGAVTSGANINGCGIGWLYADGAFSEPTPSEPEPIAKSPALYAAARIEISDGEVSSISGNWNFEIAGGIRIDTGEYWIFFANALSDDDYMAKAWDGARNCFIPADQQHEGYFVVQVTDANGDPNDPPAISVEVIRAI